MAKSRIAQADALSLKSFVTEIDEKILMIEPTSVILRVDSAKMQVTAGNVQIKVDVSGDLDPEIQKRVDARQKARAEKNYVLADEIRKELLAEGILLEDTQDGVRWKKTVPPRT